MEPAMLATPKPQPPIFCTCGEPEPHVIAHRLTYDGIGVNLWSDGAITGVLGLKLKGVPIRRPKTQEAAARLRKVGMLALGEVCIRKVDELPALIKAADKAASLDNMPGTLRRLMREEQDKPAPIKLHWQTLTTDRNGRVTERVAVLPRLRWPGVAVWDYCGGPGSREGRYGIAYRSKGQGNLGASDVTYEPSGPSFKRLSEVFAFLHTLAPPQRSMPPRHGKASAGAEKQS
jgi:hypothetical protein